MGNIARCAVALDMSALQESARFSGRTAGIRRGAVFAVRACTRMLCETSPGAVERVCCNQCREGVIAMTSSSGGVTLTRAGKPLRCKAGMDCDEPKVCELTSGIYDLIGTMKRGAGGYWELELLASEKSDAARPKAP